MSQGVGTLNTSSEGKSIQSKAFLWNVNEVGYLFDFLGGYLLKLVNEMRTSNVAASTMH